MANLLLGVFVDKRSDERTSRLMRGSVAIVIEDMAVLIFAIFTVSVISVDRASALPGKSSSNRK